MNDRSNPVRALRFPESINEYGALVEGIKSPDPMKEYRELIAAMKVFDPLKEHRELLKAMKIPDIGRGYADLIKGIRIPDPMKEHRELIAGMKVFDPLKEHRELLKAMKIPDIGRGYADLIEGIRISDPMKEYRELITEMKVFDPLKKYREQLEAMKIPDPMKEYRELATSMLRSPLYDRKSVFDAIRLSSEYRTSLSATKRALDALGIGSPSAAIAKFDELAADVTIDEQKKIVIEGKQLSEAEFHSFFNGVSNRVSGHSTVAPIEQTLAAILSELKGLQNSHLQKALTLLLLPILISLLMAVVNPVADFYIKENLGARETQAATRKIIMSSMSDRVALKPYRMVTGKALHVRSRPSKNSEVVGRLYIGQVVRLIEKQKDWSLVAWSDDDGSVTIQGWVFSRYLTGFR